MLFAWASIREWTLVLLAFGVMTSLVVTVGATGAVAPGKEIEDRAAPRVRAACETSADMKFSTTRAWIWGPPSFFFALSLIVAVAARGAGMRIFYVLVTIGTGYLLIRSLHVGVELTAEEVAVHGQMRTRRYPWPHVRRARVEPMRTASPFYRFFPYVALELDLDGGETRHFDEISAKKTDGATIEAIADSINNGPSVNP